MYKTDSNKRSFCRERMKIGKIYGEIYDTYSNRNERMNACAKTAFGWIKERSVAGGIFYYLKKINVVYNDGYFHNVQPYDKSIVDKNIIYELCSNDGKYYILGAEVMQVLWDLILILITLDIIWGLFVKKDNEMNSVFKVIILGITMYLMIFEGRSKYLFMFSPIYIVYAGLMLSELMKYINYIIKKITYAENLKRGAKKVWEIKKVLRKSEQFIKFAIVGCFNTIITLSIGVSSYIAPILKMAITVPLNFILNKVWAFKDNVSQRMNS